MNEYIELLQQLIATPSFSREEASTADILAAFLAARGANVERYGNNVVARHRAAPAKAPYLLLNSHHDTVRPGHGWTRDPFTPVIVDDRLFGLGSNDAGGPLVTMLAAFMHLRTHAALSFNVMFAATAEEEVSGQDGMAMLVRDGVLDDVALALVGEPTRMQMAVAERGLIVLDCESQGRTGHAARNEGINAIYAAMSDIEWFRTHRFARQSPVLGPTTMTVTQIDAGSQHNVVPDRCRFVVDVRVSDVYTNEELLEEICSSVQCTVAPRSMRLQSSSIQPDHLIVQIAEGMGMERYGSPTMSDQSLLPPAVASVKIGPGDSARSHTPDEYIRIEELTQGIDMMIELCERYVGKRA